MNGRDWATFLIVVGIGLLLASIRAGAEELKAQQMARELRYQQWKKTQQIQTEETPDA